jgi:hypothetical protein
MSAINNYIELEQEYKALLRERKKTKKVIEKIYQWYMTDGRYLTFPKIDFDKLCEELKK